MRQKVVLITTAAPKSTGDIAVVGGVRYRIDRRLTSREFYDLYDRKVFEFAGEEGEPRHFYEAREA